jgi:hypothetical protein
MVANDVDNGGLFCAAFMQSGSPIPVADITHGQRYFDDVVLRTGCDNSSDKLDCLRGVPFSTLDAAIEAWPGILSYQVRFEGQLQWFMADVTVYSPWFWRGCLVQTGFS